MSRGSEKARLTGDQIGNQEVALVSGPWTVMPEIGIDGTTFGVHWKQLPGWELWYVRTRAAEESATGYVTPSARKSTEEA